MSRGYVARNTIEVRVDAIDRVGEVLEIAVGSGATSVGGIRFDLKDRAKLEREALRLAVADARAKADAAAAGRRPVDRASPPDRGARDVSAAADAVSARGGRRCSRDAAAPPISAGQMELRAQVTLTAELK